MNIKDLVDNTGITALILGLPGKGKTSSIRSFPRDRTVILTSEPHGLQPLAVQWGWEECDVEAPDTHETWMEIAKRVCTSPDYDHIVVDTLSSCHDSYLENYIRNKALDGKPVHSLGIDMYRVANLQFQEMLRELLKAPRFGKNLIMLVHMKYRELEVEGKRKQYKEPSLSDNLCLWLARKCPLILRAEAVQQGPETKYFFTLGGGPGDYGVDKYGVCKEIEDNDLWEIFQRIRKNGASPKNKTNDVKNVVKTETKGAVLKHAPDKAPHLKKQRAYEEFIKLSDECKVDREKAIDWLVKQTGKTVIRLKSKDIEEATKEFKKIHDFEGAM